MSDYLLDTNALSNMVRTPLGLIEQRLELVGTADVCTSVITAAELLYGAHRKKSLRLTQRVDAVLSRMQIMAWDRPADEAYASLRSDLETRGQVIGHMDLLIAAHALALDCILVTDNMGEFRRVPGLQVENWLVPA